MMVVTALYTIESGFYGVIFSDIFQSVCIWIGVILIVIIAVTRIAGVGDLGALASSVTGNPDWLSALPQWKTQMPKGYEQYSFLFMMTLFLFGEDRYPGTGSGGDPGSSAPATATAAG
jgi:Na+/proline symporter